MLRSIPPVLTPDLLWAIAAMGHGDRLALVNANYPAYSHHQRVIALPGVSLLDAAAAILHLMPVDDVGDAPVLRMVPDGQTNEAPEIHLGMQCTLDAAEDRRVPMHALERTPFFAAAKDAFVAVHCIDNRPFGCFLITKGVIRKQPHNTVAPLNTKGHPT
jgi:L-fucose mutarotase